MILKLEDICKAIDASLCSKPRLLCNGRVDAGRYHTYVLYYYNEELDCAKKKNRTISFFSILYDQSDHHDYVMSCLLAVMYERQVYVKFHSTRHMHTKSQTQLNMIHSYICIQKLCKQMKNAQSDHDEFSNASTNTTIESEHCKEILHDF